MLITICSLRSDHLSCNGYRRNTTPHIDQFIEKAVYFKRCYTPIPWTDPSIKSLMTGIHPHYYDDADTPFKLTDVLHSVGYKT
ncbi:MAG: sulfatase-like hydrolase/transferase [Candidatus Omnitrophica bacterium]|nr:sulfatase-like hydrolase/transferase [Candidatus Omnitrophota bacterium]